MGTDDWQDTLRKALSANPPADGAHHSLSENKRHLWLGGKGAVAAWLDRDGPLVDPTATSVYSGVLEVLGKKRKGDASKIRTVAQATARHPDFPYYYGSLAEAYRNAKRIESLPA